MPLPTTWSVKFPMFMYALSDTRPGRAKTSAADPPADAIPPPTPPAMQA